MYMQIDRTNCMEQILQEFPNFRTRWDRHLESWNPIIPRPIALDIAEFSDFALETIRIGEDGEIEKLTATIEHMFMCGDSVIDYAFRTMFLEKIVSRSVVAGFPIERFISKLHPLTRDYWQVLTLIPHVDLSIHH
jgi:hypothetical protein